MVASESGTGGAFFDAGRIHLAVSQDPPGYTIGKTPDSWTGSYWVKCTYGGANKAPIDRHDLAVKFNDAAFDGTIPDHCSIAVDANYLYICYRELSAGGGGAPASPSVVLVVTKASVVGGGPVNVLAALRIDAGLALHELARDYAIDPLADPGVWVVSKGPKDGSDIYNSVRLGRVSLVAQGDPNDPNDWEYESTDLSLDAFAYRDLCGGPNAGMPGGRYRVQGPPGNNCSIWENDRNSYFAEFASCITRPNSIGVRKIWAVHAVRPSEAGGSQCQTSLQWYEIDPSANAVVASRYTLGDGDYAHDPSVAVNANGDMVITFNRSYADPSKYPGVWRLTKPYPGSVSISEEKAGLPVVYQPVVSGGVSSFWADFSGTEPDPLDPCQFWAHHMTVLNNPLDPCGYIAEQWRSWLFRFRLPCPTLSLRGNLDMNQDGELTSSDIEIYSALASDSDPEMDRTYEGEVDAWDFLDFLNEWDSPE